MIRLFGLAVLIVATSLSLWWLVGHTQTNKNTAAVALEASRSATSFDEGDRLTLPSAGPEVPRGDVHRQVLTTEKGALRGHETQALCIREVLQVVDVAGVTYFVEGGGEVIHHWIGSLDLADSIVNRFPNVARNLGAEKLQLWALGDSQAFESAQLSPTGEPQLSKAAFRDSIRRIDLLVVKQSGAPVVGLECVLSPAPVPGVRAVSPGFYDLEFRVGFTDENGRLTIAVPAPLLGARLSLFQGQAKVGQSAIVDARVAQDALRVEIDDGPKVGYALLIPDAPGLCKPDIEVLARSLSLGLRNASVLQPFDSVATTSGGHWLLTRLPGTVPADSLRVFGANGSNADVLRLTLDRTTSIEVPIGFQPLEFVGGGVYVARLENSTPLAELPERAVSFTGADLWTRAQVDRRTVVAWAWDRTRITAVRVQFPCAVSGASSLQERKFPGPGYYEWEVCPAQREVLFEFGPDAMRLYSESQPPNVLVWDLAASDARGSSLKLVAGGLAATASLAPGKYGIQILSSFEGIDDDSAVAVQFVVPNDPHGDSSPVVIKLP